MFDYVTISMEGGRRNSVDAVNIACRTCCRMGI